MITNNDLIDIGISFKKQNEEENLFDKIKILLGELFIKQPDKKIIKITEEDVMYLLFKNNESVSYHEISYFFKRFCIPRGRKQKYTPLNSIVPKMAKPYLLLPNMVEKWRQ